MSNPEETPPELDEALDEMVESEGGMRSEQWRKLVSALVQRRKSYLSDLDAAEPAERAFIEAKIVEIEGQIQVLAEEENITKFVEDTAKFSYQVHRLSQG